MDFSDDDISPTRLDSNMYMYIYIYVETGSGVVDKVCVWPSNGEPGEISLFICTLLTKNNLEF